MKAKIRGVRKRLNGILFTIVFFFGLPSGVFSNHAHDIHVSLCELRWNEEAQAFEVSIKIFIDDLELALGKEGAPGLFIGSTKEPKETDAYIAEYLRKNFRIDVDGKSLTPQFLGKEISEDFLAVWCYIEFPADISRSAKCTLTNNVLLNIYDDQRNIMDIRMNKSHKEYTIFQPGRSTWSFTY